MQKLAVSSVLAGRQHKLTLGRALLGRSRPEDICTKSSSKLSARSVCRPNWGELENQLGCFFAAFFFFYVIKKGWINWNTGYSVLPFLRDHRFLSNPGDPLTCSSNVSPRSLFSFAHWLHTNQGESCAFCIRGFWGQAGWIPYSPSTLRTCKLINPMVPQLLNCQLRKLSRKLDELSLENA